MSYEEEDTFMSYEEEDTFMSYEEEDTCTRPCQRQPQGSRPGRTGALPSRRPGQDTTFFIFYFVV